MNTLFDFLIGILRELWFFRMVEGWEKGVYTVLNKPKKVVGPGVWPVLPYFTDVRAATAVEAPITCPRQDMTLEDGTPVSFVASAVVCVHDPVLAIFGVDNYLESVQERLMIVMARTLHESTVDRFETGPARAGFLRQVLNAYNRVIEPYGVSASEVGFTSFTIKLRTYRLLTNDTPEVSVTW